MSDVKIASREELEEGYEMACAHADRGWKFLEAAVKALAEIATSPACIGESCSNAAVAKAALYELPDCGVESVRQIFARPE